MSERMRLFFLVVIVGFWYWAGRPMGSNPVENVLFIIVAGFVTLYVSFLIVALIVGLFQFVRK
jgi:hypothetical protein